jgi:nucleotide-binding universal stress UspA family protein
MHVPRILCATDGSKASTDAVRKAVEIAEERGAHLVFVLAVPWTDPRVRGRGISGQLSSVPLEVTPHDHALSAAAEVANAHGVVFTLQVVPGKAVEVILDAARRIEPELIVVGSNPAKAGRMHHGVGETVSRRAPCDVLIVRGES